MIIGLNASKYIPKILVDVSDDFEVAKTGTFRLELKTKIDGMNDNNLLLRNYWELIYPEVAKYFMMFTFDNQIYLKQYYYNDEREYVKYLPNVITSNHIASEKERLESPLMNLFNNALEFLDYRLLAKILIMVNIVKSYSGVLLHINGITGIEMRVPGELNDIVNSKLLGYSNIVVTSCQYIDNHNQYSIMTIDFK